jgi:hypothetical protein
METLPEVANLAYETAVLGRCRASLMTSSEVGSDPIEGSLFIPRRLFLSMCEADDFPASSAVIMAMVTDMIAQACPRVEAPSLAAKLGSDSQGPKLIHTFE